MTDEDSFLFCFECGAELTSDLADLALARFERMTCSSDCSRRRIIAAWACCDKAQITPCVCAYAFSCEEHGDRHVGTHD